MLLLILFKKVIELSLMGTLAVAVILIIRKLTKKNTNIKFQYAMWFIVIFRLLIPNTLPSYFSLYNYIPSYETTIMNIPNAIKINYNSNKIIQSISSRQVDLASNKLTNFLISLSERSPIIWGVGIVFITLIIVISNRIFLKELKKSKYIQDENIINLFVQCKDKLKIKKDIKLITTNKLKTPCVMGVRKIRIFIPQSSIECCNLNELKYVFLHELAHVRRNDILVNYLRTALCIIHWFNPIIWYAFHIMREDTEICCDSLALSYVKEKEVKYYGFTIIKLVEISSRAPWLPSIATIINNKSKIVRRIRMIKLFKKNSYRLSVLAVATLCVVSGSLLTGAKADCKINEATETQINSVTGAREDKIDYPFVNDEEVIGKWESVDFVKKIDDFDVNAKSWSEDLYLKSMTVLQNGQMAQPAATGITSDEVTPVEWLTWTKGYIMHHGDKTASRYIIKEINGSKYMFYEWKSGDYTLRGRNPYYYVLKQVK